jgi:Asp-tRNA(Asn)/Glu-tRNA(Gln) amidotransferase A subunit family amidase
VLGATAVDLAERVRAGALSPVAVVQAYLTHIARTDGGSVPSGACGGEA